MIHAYFDDSSDSSRAKFVACGGVFGEAFNMTVLDNLWVKATAQLEKPFRSTDCECGYDQFRDWIVEQRRDLITKLVDVLSDEAIQINVVGSVVPVVLYQKVFPGSQKGAPYQLALRHLFMQMARIARRKGRERVECWFERGSSDADVKRAFDDVAQLRFKDGSLRHRLKRLNFGDKQVSLLQAADLAAREAYKVHENFGVRPFRKGLLRLWGHLGIVAWTEDSLRRLGSIGDPLSAATLAAMPDDTFMMEVKVTLWSREVFPI